MIYSGQAMEEFDRLASIRGALDALRVIAGTSPDTAERIKHDLEFLYRKFTARLHRAEPISSPELFGRKEVLCYRSTRAWRELVKLMGPNFRITEARKAADALSRSTGVSLSATVRNHANQLMGWFEMNWDVLSRGFPPSLPLTL
jgi:hypothetical protein